MDGSGLPWNIQNKMWHKWQKAEKRDIISDLPESILTHILSFLQTKDAVRTSVLSTTWKFRWTSVTNLYFDDMLYYSGGRPKKTHFMNFVDRVLIHYYNATIQNFSLKCDHFNDPSRVNAWISAAIWRKVQKLDIYYMDKSFVFPSSLFSCNSLIELKLQLSCTLKVPISLCFPNLKILNLHHIKILNEYFSQSKQLFLSFPVLKEFNSLHCTWLNVKIVDINAPVLDCFTLKNSEYEWIADGSSDCVIKISAPSPTKFIYEGCLLEDFILSSPSSIVDAAFEVAKTENNTWDQMREKGFRACRFLGKFIDTKHLSLCSKITQALISIEDLKAYLPTFDKLTHLKLGGNPCDFWYLSNSIRTVITLFRILPNLECLIFEGVYQLGGEELTTSETVPECFFPRLKEVIINGFHGTEVELCMLKFLLKNVEALKKMTITGSRSWCSNTHIEESTEQFLSFPKASNLDSLVLSWY